MVKHRESKILVVGGLGYVGGRLVHHLASQEYEDVVISTVRPSYPQWANGYEVVSLDLKSDDSIQRCLSDVRPDVIIHLGGMQQAQCTQDPKGAALVNESGLETLCRTAIDIGVQRLVYMSSFQVYGHFVGRITEETAVDPQTVYAQTKLNGEAIVQQYQGKGLSCVTLRLANAYGYPMDNEIASSVWTLAINSFCQKVSQGQSLLIKSNQFRDFITMFDVARGIEHVLHLDISTDDRIYNLGGDNCVQIREIAERVVRINAELDPNADVKVEGPTEDLDKVFEPFDYRIDKLAQTGFALQGDMDQAIRSTLQFCYQQTKNIHS